MTQQHLTLDQINEAQLLRLIDTKVAETRDFEPLEGNIVWVRVPPHQVVIVCARFIYPRAGALRFRRRPWPKKSPSKTRLANVSCHATGGSVLPTTNASLLS
jgi:hypothetical protein